MPNPEVNESELLAAMDDEAEQGEVQITNENALIVIAQALVGIEKHLFAQVYLAKTRDPDKTGVTYIPDVFNAIYDGSDPFREVDEAIKKASAMASKADTHAG